MADPIDISEADDIVKYWLEQIEGAQKEHENWYERGKAVVKRYLDEKDANVTASHKMNVLWSNVETIKPALYAKDPNPKVSRRFRDKDPVGRWAATVLERSISYGLDAYDSGYCIRNAVGDYLLPGRGQIWKQYDPTFTGEGEAQSVEWERVKTRHLHWRDFLTNPARTWDEVWWVAKREYLSKEECLAQGIAKGIVDQITFAEKKDGDSDEKGARVKKAAVWEIWCRPKGKVYFVSKGCPELLKPEAPPGINLENFFPCPRPLTTTCTTDSIIPTPDFVQYQNQADEIDRLTQKINLLTKALRVVGIYDAEQDALGKILENTDQNQMIPCDNWAVLSQQKGIEGSTSFLPMKDIIATLQECYNARDQAKAVMYEITGISDIVRGASDPNETLGAQQIKTQWGALRIRDRQAEVQRFIRDAIRIEAEIIAEHFQLDTLKTMSNAPLLMQAEKQQLQQKQQMQQQAQQMAQANPEEAQALLQANPQLQQLLQPLSLDELQRLREPTWEEVYALLRDQKLRSFRIDIETDSTINADETEEKAARTEFLTAMTAMVTAWAPMVMQAPKFAPLFGEFMMFATRAFKTADVLESAIEEAVDDLSQQALLPAPPPQEDPKIAQERERFAYEKEKDGRNAQFEQKKHADAQAFEREKWERDSQLRSQEFDKELGFKQETEQQRAQAASKPAVNVQMEGGEILGQLAQTFAEMMQAMMGGQQQMMEMMQQGHKQNQEALLAGLAALERAAMAPKQITVQRGKDEKITGGTATPTMQ